MREWLRRTTEVSPAFSHGVDESETAGRTEEKPTRLLRVTMALRRSASILALMPLLFAGAPASAAGREGQPADRFFSEIAIPVGLGAGELAIDGGGPETLPWGPNSLVVRDGLVYVLDGAGRRIQVYDFTGHYRRTIGLESVAVGPADFRMDASGGFVVLDQNVRVLTLDGEGRLLDSRDVPEALRSRTTGLLPASLGEIVLKIGESLAAPLGRERSSMAAESTLPMERRHFGTSGLSIDSRETEPWHRASIIVEPRDRPAREIPITVEYLLGSAAATAVDGAGNLFVEVQELLESPAVFVEKSIRKYDASGRLVATYRVPLEERFSRPQREVEIDELGNVYALIPTKDAVLVRRLQGETEYRSHLDPKEAARALLELRRDESRRSALTLSTSCNSQPRATSQSIAFSFANMSWYCSAANLARSCNDGKPRFITSSGRSYTGMPYKWGGDSCKQQYLDAMAAGKDAGDICADLSCSSTDPTTSCSYGVDCSGFVNRAWEYRTTCGSHPFSTSSIHEICKYVCSISSSGCSGLHAMDAIVLSGFHVVLFVQYYSGGVVTVEATKSNSFDRAVSMSRSWSNLAGYKGYEYLCATERFH